MRLVDVHHLGRQRVIGAWLVDGCLVDPGPSASLDGLLAGLGDQRPRQLLLTHIHLDHAGAAGSLVRRWPDLEVWVHERGAPHLADPSRLVASASRLYGDDMDRLWGEVAPVPRENLRALGSGEVEIGPWRVAYTPGHASHHVSYLHTPTATLFAGDTAGVRIPPAGPVLAPTPPPDVDLTAWHRSLDLLESWRPDRLAVTHFGVWDDPPVQLAECREALDRMALRASELGEARWIEWIRAEIESAAPPATAAVYEQAMPYDTLYPGLERALRRVSSTPER
ncbi:MAG TPA: MBL fold metallo-hydrolase [Solirubrobacteraceae bacterium]|nr:MBL fold metallo-hydrolase [Solirubrobacteraceae bacterium]